MTLSGATGHRQAFRLDGLRGLIAGIANERSIGWGVARACRPLGASLALTCRNAKVCGLMGPLVREVDPDLLLPLDLRRDGELEAVFSAIESRWGGLDFIVHCIGAAGELGTRVADCSRANFLQAMEISCWSFVRMAQLAQPLMPAGGCLVTYSYRGAGLAVANYGLMGPVKAALERTVAALAAELGPHGIRVHAISCGPLSTRAAARIPHLDDLLASSEQRAPLRARIDIDDIGDLTAFLVSGAGSHLTGSITWADAGRHVVH